MSAHRTVFVLMPVEVDLYEDGHHIGRIRMPSVEEVSEAVGAGLFKSSAHPLPLPRPVWRPIEEAPSDGRWLIVARYRTPLIGPAYWCDGQWCQGAHEEPLDFTPTHWREMPATPWEVKP